MPQLLTSATNVNCQASRVESLKNALHSLISVCKRMSLKQWGKINFEGEFLFWGISWRMEELLPFLTHKNMIYLKVALSQKILENFSIANINIPNHYPGQKI